ncbi:hypothetical protein JW921_08965 [Candidatus Fermentibacterales bacterium]|nr:hypothetical protein [Candidatus Fermentibacterales bacterium]
MISLGRLTRWAIRREAAKCPGQPGHAVLQLTAEAVARRALLRIGLPSWRSDDSPGSRGRYGLLFTGGRRAIVVPRQVPSLPKLDEMLLAASDFLLVVSVSRDRTGGRLVGFATWSEYGDQTTMGLAGVPDALALHPPGRLTELLSPVSHPGIVLALATFRLLAIGEKRPAAPGDWSLPDLPE